jgi:HD-like signal output (HDOD) protein
MIGADHQAFGVGLTTKWKFPRHLRAAVGFHHNPEALSVELRNIATLIQVADMLCCQEKIGFYLTAPHDPVTDELLDVLGITGEQLEEVRASLADQVADAEATLTG